jgi:hypothetical protein
MIPVKRYNDFLNEKRKGFLGFLGGIGKGIEDLSRETVFSGGRDKETTNKNSVVNLAKNIKYTVESIAAEVDNLIAANKQIKGTSGAGDVASSLQNELREIYKYVINGINEDLSNKVSSDKISKKLKGYSERLSEILKTDLKKLKNDVLGKDLEKFGASELLSSGRDLVEKAKEIMNNLIKIKYVEEIRRDHEPTGIVKKAKKAMGVGGEKGEDKESKLKKKGDKKKTYKTFNRNPKESDSDIITEYQKRLESIGYLKDYNKGKYDDKTKSVEKNAMHFIGKISGKTYPQDDEGFALYQRDLARYVDYKDKNSK